MSWTYETILNKIQELVGDNVGSFYNISSRLSSILATEQAMLRESKAATFPYSIQVSAGDAELVFPSDFLSFGKHPPRFEQDNSRVFRLEVVSPVAAQGVRNYWLTEGFSSEPVYLVAGGGHFSLYPIPNRSGVLTFDYVKGPSQNPNLEDLPFHGRQDLNDFAQGIAYKTARDLLIMSAPTTAEYLGGLYREQVQLMRHYGRTDPQKDYHIYPTTVGRLYNARR